MVHTNSPGACSERVQSWWREPLCVGAKETTVRLQWAKLQALIGWSMKGFSLKPVELLPFLVVLETCGVKQTWTQWLNTRRNHSHTQSPWWLQTLYIISTNNWGQTIHFLPLTWRVCGSFALNIIHALFLTEHCANLISNLLVNSQLVWKKFCSTHESLIASFYELRVYQQITDEVSTMFSLKKAYNLCCQKNN